MRMDELKRMRRASGRGLVINCIMTAVKYSQNKANTGVSVPARRNKADQELFKGHGHRDGL